MPVLGAFHYASVCIGKLGTVCMVSFGLVVVGESSGIRSAAQAQCDPY